MGDELKAKIALDGADEVKKQLADIGETGSRAFGQAREAAQQAAQGLDATQSALSRLVAGFQQAAQQILGTGRALGGAFDPLVSAAGNALTAMGRAGAGIGAVAAGAAGVSAAIGKIGQDSANAVAKLKDAADAAGVTADQYRGLRAALEGVGVSANVLDRMVDASDKASRQAEINSRRRNVIENPFVESAAHPGVPEDSGATASVKTMVDDLKTSVLGAEREMSNLPTVWTTVSGQLQQIHPEFGPAQQGLRGYALAAQQLGVALKDMYGKARPGIEVARDVVLALSQMGDGAQRTDIAVRAFGDGLGKEVLTLADNREAIEQLARAHARAAASFSDGQQKQADEARRTGAVLASVKASWVEYFRALAVPVTIDQNNAVLGFFERNKAAIKDFGDHVVGPILRWLGELKNSFGVAAIAAGVLGNAFGVIGATGAVAFGALGVAAIAFGDQIQSGAIHAMQELSRIVQHNDISTFAGLKNAAAEVWTDIKQLALEAWSNLKERIRNTDWRGVWANVKGAALEAWSAIKRAALEAYGAIKSEVLASFPELRKPWHDMESAANAAWKVIKAVILGVPRAFKVVLGVADKVAAAINAVFGTHFTGAALIAAALIAEFGSKLIPIPGWLQAIVLVLSPVAALFTALAATVRGAASAIDFLLGKVQALADALSGALMSALRKLVGEDVWQAMTSAAQSAIGAMTGALNRLAAAARSAWVAITGGSTSSPSSSPPDQLDGHTLITNDTSDQGGLERSWIPGHASGGLISGPGSGTSDSILSWLSDGEFVVSAKAVQTYGAPFFKAINALTLPGAGSDGAPSGGATKLPTVAGSATALAQQITGAFKAIAEAFSGVAGPKSGASRDPATSSADERRRLFEASGWSPYRDDTHWERMKGDQPKWEPYKGAQPVLTPYKDDRLAWTPYREDQPKREPLKESLGQLQKVGEVFSGVVQSATQIGHIFTAAVSHVMSAQQKITSSAGQSGAGSRGAPGGNPVGPDESHRIPGSNWYDLNYSALVDSPDGSSPASREYDREMGYSGYAGGGHVKGPGTGISDSILARLSNGEFVMSARAVGHWGAGLFHALNNLALPGFALGGLVGLPPPVAVPAFADGGLARAPAHAGVVAFTLDQGGRSYELQGSHDVVRQLQKDAVISRMSSTTKRSPSWRSG